MSGYQGEFTYGDTAALQGPGAAETIFLAEFYDLAIDTGILEIDTGILLFEAVDLGFHDFDVELFEAAALLLDL